MNEPTQEDEDFHSMENNLNWRESLLVKCAGKTEDPQVEWGYNYISNSVQNSIQNGSLM